MEAESNTDSDSKPIFSTNAQGAVFGAIWIKKKINNDLLFLFFFFSVKEILKCNHW